MNKLIVLEGINGSGKTSIFNELQQTLDNNKFDFIKYPVNLDKEKANNEDYGFVDYTMDRYNYQKELVKRLKWKHVICDRYVLSNVVYFSYKIYNPLTRLNHFEDISNFEYLRKNILPPNLQIYIDNDPDLCYNNINKSREHNPFTISELTQMKSAYHQALQYCELKYNYITNYILYSTIYKDDGKRIQLDISYLTKMLKIWIKNYTNA